MWFDSHAVELLISAFNGRFAGTVELYASHDKLAELAAVIQGFPASVLDVREDELGSFEMGGGGVRMRLFCEDRAGHCAVELTMSSDPQRHSGHSEMTIIVIPVEPTAIDDFVNQLANITMEVGSNAILRQAS